MYKIFLVGLGGSIGSILRYAVSGLVQQWTKSIGFPFGTLAVNLLGCLLIGIASQLIESRSLFAPETRVLILVGLLGGFTTFSTFGNESLNLMRAGQFAAAVGYVVAHVVLGLGAVWLGRAMTILIWR
jgi:CrcB protein